MDRSPGHPAPANVVAIVLAISAVLVGGALFCWNWKRRAAVIATAEGLRWRGAWGDWRQVPWSGVLDYRDIRAVYRTVGSTSKPGRLQGGCEIETTVGIVRVSGDWSHFAELREAIVERATNARTTAWERKGTRPHDSWPRTFRYWSGKKSIGLAVTLLLTFGYGGCLTVNILGGVRWLLQWIGWSNTLPTLFGIVILAALAATIPCYIVSRLLRDWCRRGEKFTVSSETFTFSNASRGTDITVPWSEVGDYFVAPAEKHVVVLRGTEERQFTWHAGLSDAALLRLIVQRYAPQPAAQSERRDHWRYNQGASLAETDSRTWQSGALGMGGRVFRARHSLLGWLTASTPALIAVLFLLLSLSNTMDHMRATLPVQLTLLACSIAGWVVLLTYRVETDDSQITVISPLHRERMYWFAVEDYRGFDPMVLVGRNGKKMYIFPWVYGVSELKREIERNTPPPKTGFQKREMEEPVQSVVEAREVRASATDQPAVQSLRGGNR